MIRIELLPASFGDCILVEWGPKKERRRLLIDGGLKGTYRDALAPRLAELGAPVALELLVVTHIDRDHICGILPLLEANPSVITAKDIWFNGRDHLDDGLGAADGEALGRLLSDQRRRLPWNESFQKKAVVVPESGELPVRELDGEATLTLLSPYRTQLTTLAAEWDDTLGHWDDEAETADGALPPDALGKRPPLPGIDAQTVLDLANEDFEEDDAAPNGSSIAFLFEHEGKRILFGADAHPSVLLKSMRRLPAGATKLDAFKLPHHGSMNNLSPALLDAVECSRFLVSSNGGTFGHPHPETLAWIVTASAKSKTLLFNYSSDYTTVWDDASTRRKFAYSVEYPTDARRGLVLEL